MAGSPIDTGLNMVIEFHTADRPLALKAVSIYRKAIEAAVAACDKVYVTTIDLQTADGRAEAAHDWIAERLDEMEVGEARDLTMPSELAVTLRTACSCYLTQLSKLAEKQGDLLVPLEDTNALMSQLTSLADRLSGQIEMAGVNTVTITAGDSDPVTMTADDLALAGRRAEKGTLFR